MTHVTCRLTTKNRDQLRNPTAPEPYVRQSSIGYLYFFTSDYLRYLRKKQSVIHLPTPLENAPD